MNVNLNKVVASSSTPDLGRAASFFRDGDRSWIALAYLALVGLTISMRLIDPTGWLGSDDASYYSAAEQVLSGSKIERLHHHYARMSMILPIAGSLFAFGHSTFAVILPTFIASILCVLVVVSLGKELFGWGEGLIAGAVVAALPYFHVLSTTAYPDVHVCLWCALSVFLTLKATRKSGMTGKFWMMVIAGFCAGLAISAKIFAVAALVPCLYLMLKTGPHNGLEALARPSTRLRRVAYFVCGLGGFFLLEGLFFWVVADDFLFPLHAALQSQSGVPAMAAVDGPQTSYYAMATERIGLLMRPTVSGWGWLGVFFWPVAMIALIRRECRTMALWMLAAFGLVAFVPVSFKAGAQPYPIFHGRHILPACIPFALCLARLSQVVLDRISSRNWGRGLWPVIFASAFAASSIDTGALNGFGDRETSRVGRAIELICDAEEFDVARPIVVTPSVYWRFRILFPPPLRSQLQIATNENDPEWWKYTTAIGPRIASNSIPPNAYLIATPLQLSGQAEQWDYHVGLPHSGLNTWQSATSIATVWRDVDGRLGFHHPGEKAHAKNPVLTLMDGLMRPDLDVHAQSQGGTYIDR